MLSPYRLAKSEAYKQFRQDHDRQYLQGEQ